jgi:hypothetical protein
LLPNLFWSRTGIASRAAALAYNLNELLFNAFVVCFNAFQLCLGRVPTRISTGLLQVIHGLSDVNVVIVEEIIDLIRMLDDLHHRDSPLKHGPHQLHPSDAVSIANVEKHFPEVLDDLTPKDEDRSRGWLIRLEAT